MATLKARAGDHDRDRNRSGVGANDQTMLKQTMFT